MIIPFTPKRRSQPHPPSGVPTYKKRHRASTESPLSHRSTRRVSVQLSGFLRATSSRRGMKRTLLGSGLSLTAERSTSSLKLPVTPMRTRPFEPCVSVSPMWSACMRLSSTPSNERSATRTSTMKLKADRSPKSFPLLTMHPSESTYAPAADHASLAPFVPSPPVPQTPTRPVASVGRRIPSRFTQAFITPLTLRSLASNIARREDTTASSGSLPVASDDDARPDAPGAHLAFYPSLPPSSPPYPQASTSSFTVDPDRAPHKPTLAAPARPAASPLTYTAWNLFFGSAPTALVSPSARDPSYVRRDRAPSSDAPPYYRTASTPGSQGHSFVGDGYVATAAVHGAFPYGRAFL